MMHETMRPAMNGAEKPKMTGEAGILAGHPALDVTLENGAGVSVQLSEFWKDGPLAVIFMRHLG